MYHIDFCREEGIRTLDSNAIGIHTFQACAFDRSATSLNLSVK